MCEKPGGGKVDVEEGQGREILFHNRRQAC